MADSQRFGTIFDIKKYAIHDGPGIRTTIFLKGCPLSCWWCHNPEGFQTTRKVIYDRSRCIACHDCLYACPENAVIVSPAGLVTDHQRCTACGVCVKKCVADARQLSEKRLSVSQLMEIIRQDVLFYDKSGGGVTFSGGEPLSQPEFLLDALSACKEYDIHRVVDTSGYAKRPVIEKVARYTDLFLYDIKIMDSKRHETYTGVSNHMVLENLTYLHDSGVDIIVRIPLIPKVNDDDENLDQLCCFLKPLDHIREVHILPYHDFQKNKYSRFHIHYKAGHVPEPTLDMVSNFIQKIKANGFHVSLGG